jgi:hypothetical protein
MSSRVLGYWNFEDAPGIPEIFALRIFKGLLILRNPQELIYIYIYVYIQTRRFSEGFLLEILEPDSVEQM